MGDTTSPRVRLLSRGESCRSAGGVRHGHRAGLRTLKLCSQVRLRFHPPGRSLHGPVPLLSLKDAVVVRIQPIEEVLSRGNNGSTDTREAHGDVAALGTLPGKPWPEGG